MATWHDAGPADAVSEGETVGVAAGGVPVALFRIDDEMFALHDLCPHGQARLSDGFVEDGCVECPLHQGLIDIRNGAPRSEPITEATRTYKVRIVADRVEVEI